MKKTFINYLLIVATALFAYGVINAQMPDKKLQILVPSESRMTTDLSGSWERSEDMANWTTVRLPLSEQVNERIIYKRFVKIPADMVNNFSWQLYFLGIEHNVEIYWNEQFIGRYVGAMMPFSVKIPDNAVRKETNEIRLVLMPSESKIRQISHQYLDAKREYTGVLREVLLVGTPQVWISDIRTSIKVRSENSADINAKVSISSTDVKKLISKLRVKDSVSLKSNDRISLQLIAELRKQGTNELIGVSYSKSIVVESDRTVAEDMAFAVNGISLWSTENPELYNLTIKMKRSEIVVDDYAVPVGFRTIKAVGDDNGSTLIFNGQSFKIKGVSYIEDAQDVGQTLSGKKILRDIDLIKKLGANTIRVKYSPPHPLFVHYCNTMGILLMVELPIYDVPSEIINLDEVRVHNQNLAKQLVSNYDVNPSVLAWGIGEGVDENNGQYQKFSEIMLKIFSQDSDKLKYKILPHGMRKVYTDGFDMIGISDIRQNVDFNEINQEFKRVMSIIDGKPLFMAYGSEIQIDNHNGYSDPLSIEFQAYNILNSYKIVEKNKGIGSIINTFNDYLQNKPSLTTNNDLRYVQTSGLVDRSRRERLAFTTVQALFNNEKEPLLNAGSFTRNTPVIYLIIGILLALLLVFLINRFRRFREYMFRSILRPYNFYADIRDQRIISSVQTVLLGVVLSATVGIFLSSILNFYKESEVLEYFLMIAIPSNALKEFVYSLIWMPELSFLIITIICYALAFMIAWIIRLFAMMSRARIYWNDCLTISIWAGLPLAILLPISIVLIRVLTVSPDLIVLFLLIFAITSIWTLVRLLKSISVVFDIPVLRSYLIGAIMLLIALGAPLGYTHIKFSFFAYSSYFYNILLG